MEVGRYTLLSESETTCEPIRRVASQAHSPARTGGLSEHAIGRTVSPYPRRVSGSPEKNFPVQHWPDGEIEGNVNLTVALKVPFNLGTKQPAIVRLGIGCRTEPAGIGTFLNRSGRALQRVAPYRVGGEDSQLRTGEKSTLRFDRRSDGKDAHVSAAAESGRTK